MQLFVGQSLDAGSITASRYTFEGWVSGTAALSVTSGELVASVDVDGRLQIVELGARVDPIEIPPDVFGKPAKLTDLRVALAPTAATTIWTDDDHATATAMVDLEASWSLTYDGGALPLADQRLHPLVLDVTIGGDGDHQTATIVVRGSGELWSWAGLLKLLELRLALSASTSTS